MAASEFDPDQLHDEIAQLRGAVDRLNEVLGTATGGTIQVTDPLVATDPVNGGPETWHTLGTLSNFTVTRGRFRLGISGELEVDMQVTGTASCTVTTDWSVTIPAAYRPAVIRRYAAESGRDVVVGDHAPKLAVDVTGICTLTVPVAGVTTTYEVNGSIPLD